METSNPLLLPQHQQLLDASAITPEVAAARGYRSITTKAELKARGFRDRQCRVPALLIPLRNPAGKQVSYQLRPDEPRIDPRDGRAIKYETPGNSRMLLDVPPTARDWVTDPKRPLFVTEGVRKADSAASLGLAVVALLGVWCWRGTNRHGGKVTLSDWEYIALGERRVFIVFDSDVMINPVVYAALVRLKDFLENRGAEVSLIYLPAGEGAVKVGLDDFVAAGGTVDDLLALATSEVRRLQQDGHGTMGMPYLKTEDGLVWLKPGREGFDEVLLTNFDAKIVQDVCVDDGVETRRSFKIDAHLMRNGRVMSFSCPAEMFPNMTWAVAHLGAGAIISPGFSSKDHARAAIQHLSGDVPQTKVYGHTGWLECDEGWVFLHAGGAIGSNGPCADIKVALPDALERYRLPAPPKGAALQAAVKASLRVLDVAPDRVTAPLYGDLWRVLLGPVDHSDHIAGPTGAGKSEYAALVQQHFGAGLDARHLPASWSSTANSLEGLAFAAKDVILVVDDFAPGGSSTDVQRFHRDADRVFRAQGNHSGRQRMRPDATLKPAKHPRGHALCTGEDVPRGQSLRSRLCILEMGPNDIDWAILTVCQKDAASGLYAEVVSAFLQGLAPQYEALRANLRDEIAELRSQATGSGQHRRTPGIVADQAIGWRYFLAFAVETGALTAAEADSLWNRAWRALGEAAAAQGQHQDAVEPAGQFLALLRAALASGKAHIALADGSVPELAEAWGWRCPTGTQDDFPGSSPDWRSQGSRVGWLDGGELYLEPSASFVVAQDVGRGTGDALTITARTLKKRLHERGLLASTDVPRQVLTVRRTVGGHRHDVLHLKTSTLYPVTEPDQPDPQPASAPANAVAGRVPGLDRSDFSGNPTRHSTSGTGTKAASLVGSVGSTRYVESVGAGNGRVGRNGSEQRSGGTENPTTNPTACSTIAAGTADSGRREVFEL